MYTEDNKTMLLQLFAEEVTEEPEQVEEVTEAEEVQEVVEEGNQEEQEPVVYRDLEYKYKDEKGKLSDYAPEDVIKNFQLGKKYAEHEADIELTSRLKTMYGVKSVDELNALFDKAMDNMYKESAPENLPEDQMADWIAFQKDKAAREAAAPDLEREATMKAHVDELKAAGRIKSTEEIPAKVLDIYKNRGYTDLVGAFDSYELQQTKTKLKEAQNAASTPGSLSGTAVTATRKPVSQMSAKEYEAFKDQRRAVNAANGG